MTSARVAAAPAAVRQSSVDKSAVKTGPRVPASKMSPVEIVVKVSAMMVRLDDHNFRSRNTLIQPIVSRSVPGRIIKAVITIIITAAGATG